MRGWALEIAASTVLFAALLTLVDWIVEDPFSPGSSAVKGAVLGFVFGVAERPIRRILARPRTS